MKPFTLTHETKTLRKFEVMAENWLSAKGLQKILEVESNLTPEKTVTTDGWSCVEGHEGTPVIVRVTGDASTDHKRRPSTAPREIKIERADVAREKLRSYAGPAKVTDNLFAMGTDALSATAVCGGHSLRFIIKFEPRSATPLTWGFYHEDGSAFIPLEELPLLRQEKASDYIATYYADYTRLGEWKFDGLSVSTELRKNEGNGRKIRVSVKFAPYSAKIDGHRADLLLEDLEFDLTKKQLRSMGAVMDITPSKAIKKLDAARVEIAESCWMNCDFDGLIVEKAGLWENMGGDRACKSLIFQLQGSPQKYLYRVWFRPWTTQVTRQKYETH